MSAEHPFLNCAAAVLFALTSIQAANPPSKAASKPAAKPAAKPVAPAPPPVQMGDTLDIVMARLGAPLGTINSGASTALLYADGEVEMKSGKVSRIRWKGLVTRDPARKVTLARETPGTIEFKRVAPAQVAAKNEALRKAELDRYKNANTKIRIVQTQESAAAAPPAPAPTPPAPEPDVTTAAVPVPAEPVPVTPDSPIVPADAQ